MESASILAIALDYCIGYCQCHGRIVCNLTRSESISQRRFPAARQGIDLSSQNVL